MTIFYLATTLFCAKFCARTLSGISQITAHLSHLALTISSHCLLDSQTHNIFNFDVFSISAPLPPKAQIRDVVSLTEKIQVPVKRIMKMQINVRVDI